MHILVWLMNSDYSLDESTLMENGFHSTYSELSKKTGFHSQTNHGIVPT